jgi:hypothetical protein
MLSAYSADSFSLWSSNEKQEAHAALEDGANVHLLGHPFVLSPSLLSWLKINDAVINDAHVRILSSLIWHTIRSLYEEIARVWPEHGYIDTQFKPPKYGGFYVDGSVNPVPNTLYLSLETDELYCAVQTQRMLLTPFPGRDVAPHIGRDMKIAHLQSGGGTVTFEHVMYILNISRLGIQADKTRSCIISVLQQMMLEFFERVVSPKLIEYVLSDEACEAYLSPLPNPSGPAGPQLTSRGDHRHAQE